MPILGGVGCSCRSTEGQLHKENLHGAYLAFTQGDAHENPKPEKGGNDGQGRKNPGEETTAKKSSAPAADTRHAL